MTRSTEKSNASKRSAPALLRMAMLAAAVLAAIAAAPPAFAQTAEELRRDGQACELPTGYLEALEPAARTRVDAINDQRRARYEMLAMEEGVEAIAVAAVYAQELVSLPNYRACTP